MYAQPRRRAFVPCRRGNFPKCNCRVCCFIAIALAASAGTAERVTAETLVGRSGRRATVPRRRSIESTRERKLLIAAMRRIEALLEKGLPH